jgi:hypothetical protein
MARKGKGKKQKSRKIAVPRGPGVLPMVEFNPTNNRTFRYFANAAANNLIVSRGDLLNTLVMACSTGTAGTTGARLMFAVKVNWIHVFVSPNSNVLPQQTNLTWEGMYGKAKVIGTTTLGISNTSEFHAIPPRNTEAGFYSLTGSQESQPLFNMDLSASTVVDINLSFTLQNLVDNSTGATIVSSTKTVAQGYVYCSALDGTATNVLTPLGMLQW